MRAFKPLASVLLVASLATVASAGIRAAGKYCGVVVYDRWGGCTLYSGIYVMYVAEGIKDKLRDHAGEPVQVDAKSVYQPENPGDGLIKALDYLGAAPAADVWASGDGLRLRAATAFEDGGTPAVVVTVENISRHNCSIDSSELAPTLLTRKEVALKRERPFIPADGPSFAVVTRTSFYGFDGPRARGKVEAGGRVFAWRVGEPLPRTFVLGPGEERRIRIDLDLPEGEYDFLAGYGGGTHAGRGLASNLVAFDVGAGSKAKAVRIEGR